jgi:hypothetical protein
VNQIPPATVAKISSPAPEGQRHNQAVQIACSLIGNGLSPDAVFVQLRDTYPDDVTDRELQDIVGWAAQQGFQPSGKGGSRPVKIRRLNAAHPAGANSTQAVESFLGEYRCTEADTVATSPVKTEDSSDSQAITILRHLYRPNDLVNIVTQYTEAHSKTGKVKYNPKGYGITKTASEWIAKIERDNVPIGAAGVWIRMNPLDGKGIADANVVAHRLALVEFDNIPLELQLPFLRRLPVPLAAIIASGGKSIHGWVAVNAGTESEYDETVAELLALLKSFGVDQSNKNPSRLSRLPGAFRRLGGTGDGCQRLLYCDPSALQNAPLDLTALREAVTVQPQMPVLPVSTAKGNDNGSDKPANICAKIVGIMSNTRATHVERHEAIAKAVVVELRRRGRFYFHALHRDYATAMHFDGTTKRLLRVQADEFLSGVAMLTGVNRGNPVFRYIQAAVEDAALTIGAGIVPEAFWASRVGVVYVSNGDGSVARIADGVVSVVDNGTDNVLFAAGATLRPWTLTEARDPFATCSLLRDANYADAHSKMLLKLWMLSLPTNPNCKPPLSTAGLIRSGKTRTVRGICELYGLPFAAKEPNKSERSETDFWVAMDGGGLFCLDNCDNKVDWLPDAVAAASTGVGDIRRQLYTERATMELKPRAWLALTSANPTFAADVGVADRLLAVRLNQRTGENSDEALSVEIAGYRDAALSWIVNTLATALADTEKVPAGLNKRHPDFAAFAVRLGRALGCEEDAVAALAAAETDKSRLCLENDPVGAALLAMMGDDNPGFQGNAGELLARYDDQMKIVGGLAKYDSDFSPMSKGNTGKPLWSAKRLGKRMATLWVHIEAMFDAKRHGNEHGHASTFTIKNPQQRFERFAATNPVNSPREYHTGSLPESLNETAQTAISNPSSTHLPADASANADTDAGDKATINIGDSTPCTTCGGLGDDCDCWILGQKSGDS